MVNSTEGTVGNPLEQLLSLSTSFDEHKADAVVNLHECRFAMSGRLILPVKPEPVVSLADELFGAEQEAEGGDQAQYPHDISKLAKTQLVAKLYETDSSIKGYKGAAYLRNPGLPADLFAYNMEYWRERYKGRNSEWLVRTYDRRIRAVLNGKYPVFQNTSFLQMAIEYSDELNYYLVRPYICADSMYVKMLWPPDNDTHNGSYWDVNRTEDTPPYRVGVALVNNEVGGGKIKILPMLQNWTCQNSMLFTDGGWELSHNLTTGRGEYATPLEYIRASVKTYLTAVYETSKERIDEILRAETDAILNPAEAIEAIAKSRGYSQEVQQLVMMGTELEDPSRPSNRMAIVNGLSAAGKVLAQRGDHDSAYGLETAAGTALIDPVALDAWVRDGLSRKRAREEVSIEIS